MSRQLVAQAALFRRAAPASSSLHFGGLVSDGLWRCLLISSTKLSGNSLLGSRSGTGRQMEAPEGLKLLAPAPPKCEHDRNHEGCEHYIWLVSRRTLNWMLHVERRQGRF